MLSRLPATAKDQAAPSVFSPRERAALLSVLQAALPAGARLPGADGTTLAAVEAFMAHTSPVAATALRAILLSLEAASFLRHGASLAGLDSERCLEVLEGWRRGSFAQRSALRVLLAPAKVALFSEPATLDQLGCRPVEAPVRETRPRWMEERILSMVDVAGESLECDVVVIGTGAGGAVVAKELAEGGAAVVMVEEGEYFTRADFGGHAIERQGRLYRDGGASFTVGNTAIFLPVGKSVGGTTTINSGTCYRAPERIFRSWRERFGLTAFSSESMAPYYDRVESILGVSVADARHLGGIARIIARGCDALGYHHGALMRNAPECDGRGTCCFGCPTDAKRSTNVSYVPMALRAAASLLKGARVDEILVEGGRAVGVRAVAATAADGARPRSVTVRARAVVVACGALMTPILLEKCGLAGGSGQLGRNLSIHPAAGAVALFDEDLHGYHGIPQGYAIDQFHDEGLIFEGAFAPPDVTAASTTMIGSRFTELMESYNQLAVFGFMIEDVSRGRVRRGPGGRPLMTYSLVDADVARLKRGVEILSRVYFAAGARRVMPIVHGFEEFHSPRDLDAFRAAKVRARDFDLSAYHPLGTARMGVDPAASVVGPDHQTHDVKGLYVIDGASVPSALSVNPQTTIMAMATRAAGILAERL